MKINPAKVADGANEDAASSVKAEPESVPDSAPPTIDLVAGTDNPGSGHAGRYRLDRLLGKGSFGEVWQGFDPVLQVVVAIKRPRADRNYPASESDLFVDEARKQAALNHPAIVKIRHAEREGSSWLIVSEFIDGVSLAASLSKRRYSPAESARLVADVADALHAAHRQRLIHRDVKPGNILIDKNGRPFLTDFGLALAEQDQQKERNVVAGTYAYMSPEQIRGDAHFLDGRTDIYSLGVVLYELLTGERPFRGATLQDYREQILHRAPRPPRATNDAIPRELERICLRCLSKSSEERYATGADLASELRRAVQPRSARWRWAGLGVGVAGLALAVGLSLPWTAPIHVKEKKEEKPAPPPVAELPKPVERDGWTLLRDPKKLVWPRAGESTLEWNESEGGRLVAHCEDHGLIQLGEVNEPNYTIRMELKMDPRGTFGVLLGYTYFRRGGQEFARAELIRVRRAEPGSKKVALSHYLVEYSELAGGLPMGQAIGYALVDELPPRACPLEITVENDVLKEVRWDGRPLLELTSAEPPPGAPLRTWKGKICCYLNAGVFYLHSPKIKKG